MADPLQQFCIGLVLFLALSAVGQALAIVFWGRDRPSGEFDFPNGCRPWYAYALEGVALGTLAIMGSRVDLQWAVIFGVWALLDFWIVAWTFWKERVQFTLRHALVAMLVVSLFCSASRYVPAALLIVFLASLGCAWAEVQSSKTVPSGPLIPDPTEALPRKEKRWVLVTVYLLVGLGFPLFVVFGAFSTRPTGRIGAPGPGGPQGAAGLPQLAPSAIPGVLRPQPPPAYEPPEPGKSVLIAAPQLREVTAFDRKVVFFAHDADLPCLRLPDASEMPGEWLPEVPRFVLSTDGPANLSPVMTKGGDIVFATAKALYRLGKDDKGERLVALADLEQVCSTRPPETLRFHSVLATSTTKNTVYVGLETSPEPSVDPGPYTEEQYPEFVGKLDLDKHRLLLTKARVLDVAIDPEAEAFYRVNGESVEQCDFQGRVLRRWPLSGAGWRCRLSPDRKKLLVCDVLASAFFGQFILLELDAGREHLLPLRGKAATPGLADTVYYVQEVPDRNGVRETSLYRYDLKSNTQSRLFFVATRSGRMAGAFTGPAPRLSADGTWLAWPMPGEWPAVATVLLDLISGQYRVVPGLWRGVSWNSEVLVLVLGSVVVGP